MMVSIRTDRSSQQVCIVGHGISLTNDFELMPGITITSTIPALDMNNVADGSKRFFDYAMVVTGHPIASFAIQITDERSPELLAVKSWNALWLFHLLSLACKVPCCSLYSVTGEAAPIYSAANRNFMMRPLTSIEKVTSSHLQWAKTNHDTFDRLIKIPAFNAAMRCYGNAHYLFDSDMRIMLLWSGIEGLLSVDAELNRRIALYAALMLDGSVDEKITFFEDVKKAYGIRSKAVHGGVTKSSMLEEGYRQASRILILLLVRCVELGRVPSVKELDALAVSSTLL
ncbi:hypothetical protein [Labrys sp. 22185]|uniref:hypothetical protein n=1 Tax=Labrys sp. 22185 TaxID=3453888 RepID=UPI003F84F1E8